MKITIRKELTFGLYGERWLRLHTNRCFCSLRGCRRAKREKDYIAGWNIGIGRTVIRIERRKPKGCTAPF